MSNRNILTISPLALTWYEDNEGVVIVENYYNKRKVFLDEQELSTLWKIIIENSDYQKIEENFCSLWSREDFKRCLNLLKRAGIIKINFTKEGSNEGAKS
ncbi:MAG: hypothetical protein ABIN61_08785 [candidate division WOR-3 bacterium]